MTIKNIKEQPYIVIHDISEQHTLTDEQYAYILRHLNIPLKLLSTWYINGILTHITIEYDDSCITLFNTNGVDAMLVYPDNEERTIFSQYTHCKTTSMLA